MTVYPAAPGHCDRGTACEPPSSVDADDDGDRIRRRGGRAEDAERSGEVDWKEDVKRLEHVRRKHGAGIRDRPDQDFLEPAIREDAGVERKPLNPRQAGNLSLVDDGDGLRTRVQPHPDGGGDEVRGAKITAVDLGLEDAGRR